MHREEILLAFSAGGGAALGNVWRITAKRTDFYIEPYGAGEATGLHLSAHGPNEKHNGHRFHVKIDATLAGQEEERGGFIKHRIPRKGAPLDGVPVAPRAWRIARLRWTWQLQRQRFQAVAVSGDAPAIAGNQAGLRQDQILKPNAAWDVDLVVSYDEPHWPESRRSRDRNARVGPLRSGGGLWLTGTSYARSQSKHPAPEGLTPPLPSAGESAARIMCGGWDGQPGQDMYWFVETITSQQFIADFPA